MACALPRRPREARGRRSWHLDFRGRIHGVHRCARREPHCRRDLGAADHRGAVRYQSRSASGGERMNLDDYEEKISGNLAKQLGAIGENQQLTITLFREVRAELAKLDGVQESNQELRALILHASEQIAELRAEVQAMRAKLNGS